MTDSLLEKSIEYLKTDSFKHLSTLKYLTLYRDKLTMSLLEERNNWAILVTIPTEILSYDTATYPYANKAIFINGTSEQLIYRLLDTLPENNYILRLNEDMNLLDLKNRFKIKNGNSFVSYSCSTFEDYAANSIVLSSTHITDETVNIIMNNGYSEKEIKKYFDSGSVWFGVKINDKIQSVCFIYQNYNNIWEIAGVHTLETERNKGYARIVVTSAIAYLLKNNLVPRYEADARNTNSIKLAQSLKMKEFLRINHFLLSPL